MRRSSLISFVIFLLLCIPLAGANRITTWASGNILTASALNGEFNNVYSGTIDRTGGRWGQNSDVTVTFGTSQNVSQRWSTVQTNPALLTGLAGSFTWIIHNDANSATNYAYANRTNPALIIKSNTVTAANYLELQHNDTDAVVNAGAGGIDFQTAATRRMFLTSTSLTLTDDLLFIDATYDIGKSGATRPRDIFTSRNATFGNNLVVSGVGPHAIGGATAANAALLVTGTFTPSAALSFGTAFQQTLNVAANQTAYALAESSSTLNKAASGTHPDFVGCFFAPPTIGAGAAALTNASTVKISGAPTEGTNNYTLWSTGGSFRFDGVGPHAIGGATLANTQFVQQGTFTPSAADSALYYLNSTLNAAAGQVAITHWINTTVVEAGSGIHSVIAGLRASLTITNAAATVTDAIGIDIPTFVAGAGTTNATGLRVAQPTGATNNYAINVTTGDIFKAGTAYNNPDYVFDQWIDGKSKQSSYKGLMPLADLREFIVTNRHLPGISRKESGIFSRADMVLEKVEEQALYILQLEERVKYLEQLQRQPR